MSGYAGWLRERRYERKRWAAFKADTPFYRAIRLAERAGFWYARRRNLKYIDTTAQPAATGRGQGAGA